MRRSAVFSPYRLYRYELWRRWDDTKPYCQFVGLNPSTADENVDDPTVRRCIKFAMDWGYGALAMTNIFGFRSTDPKGLRSVEDRNCPGNDETLVRLARGAGLVIAAWGDCGWPVQCQKVEKLLLSVRPVLHCLGTTKYGYPRHPLYVRKDTIPIEFKIQR